jgi:hypothetical protein
LVDGPGCMSTSMGIFASAEHIMVQGETTRNE